ncbi:IWS1-like protein, putative [Plasmodium relictum]|uniref:IWS1-like protein, putative n=1 Tax=Plasmodium relictum TaxID=85471 RepID=A0A1J1H4V1_PLARL|nr:IWS1-like protein, putative [Plasmodium relictum]CRG99956.1 IWS1-like protein, putative [Plasmodium relictum]
MEMNINKNIDESLKISKLGDDENDLEGNNEENVQEKTKLLNLHVEEKKQETKYEKEEVQEIQEEGDIKEGNNEEQLEDENEEEQEYENEEEHEDENEEDEEKIEVNMEYVEEHRNKVNFNEKYVGDKEDCSNNFKNYSSNNNVFTNERITEENNNSSYEELINKKQQNAEDTLCFDKNENEEILDNNDNTMKTNIVNDGVSEELLNKNKRKEKFNKKKRNLSGNESNETKNDDTDDKILRKKKKKMLRLKKNKYIDNAAEEEEKNKEEQDDEMSSDNDINKKKKYISKKMDHSDIILDEEYEMENDDSNKSQKKKKNYFDEILENLKFRRKRAPKISEDDGLQYCENVLNQMILVHEQDMKNMKERKPATSKLQIIDEVCKILTKPKWKPFFMKLNIYHVLALWLMPTSKNTLPNFTIRTNLLKVIQQLPITIKSLRGSQLGKIMTYLHSHKDETEENKKLIRSILQNWMGPIIGINTNYKQFLKERQKKIMENPEFHKKVLEKAKTLIPDSICIEKEEEQNEFKRHATIPYNSECSFLINVPSSVPNSTKRNIPKSKIKRLTDSMKLNKRFRKTQKVSIEGKGVAVAP